jgi:hypothetical protein
MTKEQAEKIIKLLGDIDIDVSIEDITELEDVDQVEEYLSDNNYFDVEIIYNSRAMEYLAEHDASLQYSLGLAHDMGYSADKLNSEILASLLASENIREEFSNVRGEIEEILSN